jgi:EamA domain-containing membrane protein RarD
MTETRSQHRLGIALVVAAAIAWSTAPFFTRLLAYDSWTILFWRGLFGGGLIMVLMVLLQGRAGLRDLARIDINGWLVASFSTLAMIAFIPSLQLTNVSSRRALSLRRGWPGYGCGKFPIGEPCWRASWRSAASSSS